MHWKMVAILSRPQCVKPSGAETEIFPENQVSTMSADAMAHCITGLSASTEICHIRSTEFHHNLFNRIFILFCNGHVEMTFWVHQADPRSTYIYMAELGCNWPNAAGIRLITALFWHIRGLIQYNDAILPV